MLDFKEVNSWFRANIATVANIRDIPVSAVDALLKLYDKQTPEFNEQAKRLLANHSGEDFIDVVATINNRKYKPNPKRRTDNGVGCVILSSNPRANEYKIVTVLVIPKWYCLIVTLELDGKKKVLGGSVVYKNYYTSPHIKPFVKTANGAGPVMDNILLFKDKVDNMVRLDPVSKPMPAKVKFKVGEGLIKDED